MRKTLLLLILSSLTLSAVAGTGKTPDWNAWFKKNVMANDKKDYVHIFWNAQDVRANFKGKDKVAMLAKAARELVARQYPEKAAADLVKIDIVYVRERDEYGMPKWNTLERAAHLEGSRAALLKLDAPSFRKKDDDIKKFFAVFRTY